MAKQRSKHDDKQVYYGIVNLRPDELVKLGTNLDKGEQELFHKIVRGRPPSKAGAQHARAHALCPRPHSSTRSTRARRRRLTRSERTTSGTSARRGSARMTPRPACSSAPATHRPMRICPGVAPTRPSPALHSLTRPSPDPHSPLPVAASRLEHGQWLHKSDDGSFSLGIRILLQRMYTSNATAGEA